MRGSQCHAAGARPVCDLPLPVKRYPPPPPTVIGRRPSTAPRGCKWPLVCLDLPGEHDPRSPLGAALGKSRAMPRNTRDTIGLPPPLSLCLPTAPSSLSRRLYYSFFLDLAKRFIFFIIKKWRFPIFWPSLRDLISSCCHERHEKASTVPWPSTPEVQLGVYPPPDSTMASKNSMDNVPLSMSPQ